MVLAGLTGFAGGAAHADDAAEVAPTSGAEFEAQASELLALEGVEAVTVDAAGTVVLTTTDPVDALEDVAEEFVEDHRNVEVRLLDAPLSALSVTDVVGGAGYAAMSGSSDDLGLCSIGFAGFTPDGAPAVVSAGHCTDDGSYADAVLTVPAGDPAGGGATGNDDIAGLAELGAFGFSQFGGPGNTEGQADAASTDVSVIDVTNTDLDLLPVVTDWTTTGDLSASTRPVTAVGTARPGASVVKSGRTTGFTSGTVDSIGYASVDGRTVYGFWTDVPGAPGDSGGAVLQGSTAVGVVSGGGTAGGAPVMFAADLQAALAVTGGYSVAVQVAAPVLTGPATGSVVAPGATISGTAGAGTTLAVEPSVGEPFEVPVGAAGTWSFPATEVLGPISYTLVARSGYSASAPTVLEYEVLPVTALTSPGDGERVLTSVQRLAGVGAAGEDVALTGDVEAVVEVAEDGTWEHEVDLSYGRYTVTVQQITGTPGEPSTSTFEVVPVAPAITDPVDGGSFTPATAPTTVSGTGLDGARVGLDTGHGPLLHADVVDGTWTIELPEALEARDHRFTANQSLASVDSDFGQPVTFTVAADAAVVGDDVAAAAAPGGGDDGVLAQTGVSAALIVLVAAMLVGIGAHTVIRARRTPVAGVRTIA
ncbi:hypothetical protein EBM89_02610 [Cellulomonas triticagri]|uniref:Peptidase S1 domain-containing protein n=2 Tax=Cellulomonas triticagri TaxID=2483352 RepID=A0A3M2JNJ2_9CELL|nr:hypothetical protein EBM89_02610 [Cellulomonas triticagri]